VRTKIHGAIWVVLGLAMWLYLGFIEGRGGTSLPALKWVGVLFLVWGAFRLSNDYLFHEKFRRPKQETPVGPPNARRINDPTVHHTHAPQATHQHVQTPPHQLQTHQHVQQAPLHPGHPHAQHTSKQCPQCRNLINQQARFCNTCGFRFW